MVAYIMELFGSLSDGGYILWNFSEWISIEIIPFSLENTIEI